MDSTRPQWRLQLRATLRHQRGLTTQRDGTAASGSEEQQAQLRRALEAGGRTCARPGGRPRLCGEQSRPRRLTPLNHAPSNCCTIERRRACRKLVVHAVRIHCCPCHPPTHRQPSAPEALGALEATPAHSPPGRGPAGARCSPTHPPHEQWNSKSTSRQQKLGSPPARGPAGARRRSRSCWRTCPGCAGAWGEKRRKGDGGGVRGAAP